MESELREIKTVAKFKTSSIKAKVLKEFHSSFYKGQVFIVAVDGVGIFLYSLADLKCIKNFPVESTVSFQCVPVFDPSTESIFFSALSKDQLNSTIEKLSLSDSSVVATFDLGETVVHSMEVSPSNNGCLLVSSINEKIFLFSNQLQLLDQIKLESCHSLSPLSHSSLLVRGDHSIDKISKIELIENDQLQLTVLSKSTPFDSNDLIYFSNSNITIVFRKKSNDLIVFNWSENNFYSHKTEFSIDSIICCRVISDNYYGILTDKGILHIFNLNLNTKQLEMNVKAISSGFNFSSVRDFFLLGEDGLCFVFEDRFGLIKLPVQLKEFNLAQAFATKSSLQLSELPANLTDLGNEQLLGNLDKLSKSFIDDNLEKLFKSERISTWIYPNLLQFLIKRSDPILVDLFVKNSVELKEQDFIEIIKYDSSQKMLKTLFGKDTFTASLMIKELSKCTIDFAFDTFKKIVLLIKSTNKRLEGNSNLLVNLINFLQCLIDSHFINFLLSTEKSLLKEFKELFQYVKQMELETKEIILLNSYLEALKEDSAAMIDQSFNSAKYSIETLNF